ncbi:MAG: ExbD/TolR family protein [Myxococcota bacterium]
MADIDNSAGFEVDHEEEERMQKERKAARKARRDASNHGPGEAEMNLTALMDVLTIMLVFLLKNYSTDPVVNLTENLKPPESSSTLSLKEAITVSITRDDITVGDKIVCRLNNGKVNPSDRTQDEALKISCLFQELTNQVDMLKTIADRGGKKFEGNMLVVGDRSIDYELLSSVLYTAGQAELAQYKFVTISF